MVRQLIELIKIYAIACVLPIAIVINKVLNFSGSWAEILTTFALFPGVVGALVLKFPWFAIWYVWLAVAQVRSVSKSSNPKSNHNQNKLVTLSLRRWVALIAGIFFFLPLLLLTDLTVHLGFFYIFTVYAVYLGLSAILKPGANA